MKKFICLVVILCTCVVFMDACSNKALALTIDNTSEVHYNLYAGSSGEVTCTFSSGQREQTYVLDGYHTNLVDFGLLTFYINNDNIASDTASYTLSYDAEQLEGILEQNPYDGSFVTDISKIITEPQSMIATIRIGSFVKSINMIDISSTWQISYNDALKIAVKHKSKELKQLIDGNNLNAEVYIKILSDTTATGIDNYFWFVSILSRDGHKFGVLIHPISGEILATK